MKILKFIKEKKIGLSFLIAFFILLLLSLVLHNIFPKTYPISILFVVLIFIFSQYFNFDYRLFISFALFLLIICPFLLIAKLNTLAEYFASYVYGFLCLGVIGFFLDNLREKAKNKGKLKVYKLFITFFISLMIIFTIFFYFNNFLISFKDVKLYFLKETNQQRYFEEYYKGINKIFTNGKFISNEVLMDITFPDEKLKFVDQVHIEGWALDKNSNKNSGIDKVEVWLDGKPGQGKFLGNANLGININPVISGFTEDKFKNCGFNADIKIENINSGNHDLYVYAHSDLFGWVYKEINIEIINTKDYSNKNKIAEAELYDKDIKIYIDKPNDLEIIYDNFEIEGWALDLNSSIDSNNPGIDKIEVWLDGYPGIGKLLIEGNLNKERSDLVPVFGKQFLKAGYLYKLNMNDIGKGKHMIFVFAHSIYSGWSKNSVRIEVK